MTYKEQLLDPRWQKKRLHILNRDNFTCQECLSTDKPLHVHHRQYFKDFLAWEYSDYYLRTLCSDCHKLEELIKSQKKVLIKNMELQGRVIPLPCPACGNQDVKCISVGSMKCNLCGFEAPIEEPIFK